METLLPYIIVAAWLLGMPITLFVLTSINQEEDSFLAVVLWPLMLAICLILLLMLGPFHLADHFGRKLRDRRLAEDRAEDRADG